MEASSVAVAFPPKIPLPPRRRTLVARALYEYNLHRGYSSQRTWFSGKLFAIRDWHVPTPTEVRARAQSLPRSPFHDLLAPLRVDDIYLSRRTVTLHGVAGLRETRRGAVYFRAPETLGGAYQYYRRMRREIERNDMLFPEMTEVHRMHGRRAQDLLPHVSRGQRAWHRLLQGIVLLCRAALLVRAPVDQSRHTLGERFVASHPGNQAAVTVCGSGGSRASRCGTARSTASHCSIEKTLPGFAAPSRASLPPCSETTVTSVRSSCRRRREPETRAFDVELGCSDPSARRPNLRAARESTPHRRRRRGHRAGLHQGGRWRAAVPHRSPPDGPPGTNR